MSSIVTDLEQISLLNLLWIFFFIFVLHEFEEWNIDRFERQHFEGLPPAATDRSARMWIGFVSLVGLIWCAAAALPGNPRIAAWIFLPAIAILLQNALQHIYWSWYFRQYAPGVITAALLLIPAGCYVIARAIEQGYVPTWYVAVLAALIMIGSAQTIRAGNKMTPLIRTINNIGIWLSDRIR
ncbi:MAG: HXXEE domain-containing protein [Chloroflexi bacterium]|nr:MAG: HXXEE domain-containing protein [Chloroflexota bacterium]